MSLPTDIARHFTSLGAMPMDIEGQAVTLELFQCIHCHVVVAVPREHIAAHISRGDDIGPTS